MTPTSDKPKVILITVIRGLVPDEARDALGPTLAKLGVYPVVLTLNAGAAGYGNRAVEVYCLDGLPGPPEIKVEEIRRLCEASCRVPEQEKS